MKKLLFISGLLALPVLVLAQGGGNLSNTKLLLTSFRQVITTLTIIAASLALLVFIWGLVKYIANAEDEGAKEGGRRLMVQGAIALFVLFAIFGIIRWIGIEVGITPGTPPILPPIVIPPPTP
ncbi:MAG: hypothetical protein AAB458_00860 [Patescibacteria group bacterium]